MVHALWLVLHDLWLFLWGQTLQEPRSTLAAPPAALSLGASPRPSQIGRPVPPLALRSSLLPERPQHELPFVATSTPSVYAATGATYVVSHHDGAALLLSPAIQLDGRLMVVPFGQSVSLRRFVEQYAEVLVYGITGFVHKDDITPHLDAVWPIFKAGQVYDYDADETMLVRRHIDDEFMADQLHLPLLASEYVTVRLLRDRLAIPWPKVRPRTVGSWHTLLRGVTGVHSGVMPATDTVMEWLADDGEGRLAYVEAVLPDSTLKISAVGIVVPGEYTESIVPAAVWREWRPVFINIR